MAVHEGPTYVVAPDFLSLIHAHLVLGRVVMRPEIGACEVDHVSDARMGLLDDCRAYVRLDLWCEGHVNERDAEVMLSPLPFKAYRFQSWCGPPPEAASLLDFDWSDVLPDFRDEGQQKRALKSRAS